MRDISVDIQKALYDVILNELMLSYNLEEAIQRVEKIGELLNSLDAVTQLQNLLAPLPQSGLEVLAKQSVALETS